MEVTTDQTESVFLSKSEYDNLVENNYIYSNSQYVDMLIDSKNDIDEGKSTRTTINSIEGLLNL